jgi:hypothetical protein
LSFYSDPFSAKSEGNFDWKSAFPKLRYLSIGPAIRSYLPTPKLIKNGSDRQTDPNTTHPSWVSRNDIFPETLTHLSFTPANSDILNDLPTKLVSLECYGARVDVGWLARLPLLRELTLPERTIIRIDPNTEEVVTAVEHLKLPRVEKVVGPFGRAFPCLKSLHAPTLVFTDQSYSPPPTVTYLSYSLGSRDQQFTLLQTPVLASLSLTTCFPFLDEIHLPNLLASLPKTLSSLSLPYSFLSSETIPLLPESLTHLYCSFRQEAATFESIKSDLPPRLLRLRETCVIFKRDTFLIPHLPEKLACFEHGDDAPCIQMPSEGDSDEFDGIEGTNWTNMYVALRQGHFSVLLRLCELGYDLDKVHSGVHIVEHAVKESAIDALDWLKKNWLLSGGHVLHSDGTVSNHQVLKWAISYRSSEVLDWLFIEQGYAALNSDPQVVAICSACGDSSLLQKLSLEYEIDFCSKLALTMAVVAKSKVAVDWMISQGARELNLPYIIARGALNFLANSNVPPSVISQEELLDVLEANNERICGTY